MRIRLDNPLLLAAIGFAATVAALDVAPAKALPLSAYQQSAGHMPGR